MHNIHLMLESRIEPKFSSCGELRLYFIFHASENIAFYIFCGEQLTIIYLSYDVASGSEITPCNKIDKAQVVYRFTGNVMTSITTLRTY